LPRALVWDAAVAFFLRMGGGVTLARSSSWTSELRRTHEGMPTSGVAEGVLELVSGAGGEFRGGGKT
jgi:hypothetical protein